VNADAIVGRRVGLVLRLLRQLGLRPRVVWAVNGGTEPGTVISVQPSGQVRAGGTVLVTAALRPPGHRHGQGHGDGHGHGGGDGQGDGNGGG
jgi:hypothetical protein